MTDEQFVKYLDNSTSLPIKVLFNLVGTKGWWWGETVRLDMEISAVEINYHPAKRWSAHLIPNVEGREN